LWKEDSTLASQKGRRQGRGAEEMFGKMRFEDKEADRWQHQVWKRIVYEGVGESSKIHKAL
jgi:hypothetical protein